MSVAIAASLRADGELVGESGNHSGVMVDVAGDDVNGETDPDGSAVPGSGGGSTVTGAPEPPGPYPGDTDDNRWLTGVPVPHTGESATPGGVSSSLVAEAAAT